MRCNTCGKEIKTGDDVYSTYGFESWVHFCSEECRNVFKDEDSEDES